MPPDPESREPMLSTSPSHSPLPSPLPSPGPPSPQTDVPIPPWIRPNQQHHSTPGANARRLSTPYSRSAANDDSEAPFGRRVMRASISVMNKMIKLFYSLSPLQRALAIIAIIVFHTLLILFLVYSHRIFAAFAPVAIGWRALPGGWLIVFFLTCACAFPPMVGYSTCITLAGFVYGFPGGWPIVAAATVFGSTASFLASRTIFSRYVHALVGGDKRFVALGQVLRRDGLLVLAAIRFCPLPFSLSNGFLATIPSITPVRFALATAMATPKLLVHVFIGSRLALLAENGDEMSAGDRAINYLSMFVGSLVGLALSLLIYQRTMARATELSREEVAENGIPIDGGDDGSGGLDYADLEGGMMHRLRPGEADEAALMNDDDISLWETDGIELGYRDEEDTPTSTTAATNGGRMENGNGGHAKGRA